MTCGALASLVALQLAAGAVIDGAVATEARLGVAPEEDAAVNTLAPVAMVPVLMATPSLRAALQTERLAAIAGYSLQLSGLTDPLALAVLHSGEAALELAAGRQFRLRGRLTGQAGELDPLQAQLTLADTGRTDTDGGTMPYMGGAAALTAETNLTRRLVFDATAEAGAAVINAEAASTLYSAALRLGSAYQLSRKDDARIELAGLIAQRALVTGAAGIDTAPGAMARAEWARRLGRDAGVALGAGAAAFALMRSGAWVDTALRPVADARAQAAWSLPGGRTIATRASLGVGVTSNPFGDLVESRASAELASDVLLAPGLSAGASFTGFVPLPVSDAEAVLSATFGQAIARMAWSITDELRLDCALWLTSSTIDERTRLEAAATIGLSGHLALWHTGSRPRGTDPRAGREVGVRRIGERPAPGQQEIEEPPPPPPLDEETLPPELIPPAVQPPLDPPPPPPPVRLKRLKPAAKPLGDSDQGGDEAGDEGSGGDGDEGSGGDGDEGSGGDGGD